MENILALQQIAHLIAIVMIIIASILGIILYLWFQQIQRKAELLVKEMKQNIDNLEYLAQYVYEAVCSKGKGSSAAQEKEEAFLSYTKTDELKEVKKQIQSIIEKQSGIGHKLNQKLNEDSPGHDEIYSSTSKNKIYSETFPPEEKSKYKEISELIVVLLKDLLSEKGQVTAQELVYTMPSQYPLAEIYRSLEMMKENKQIDWEDKSIHPQSVLKLPE